MASMAGTHRRGSRDLRWIALAVVAGGLLGLIAFGAAEFARASALDFRIADGVYIGDLNVGGMKMASAQATVEQLAASLESLPVSLEHGGDVWRLYPKQIGMSINVEPLLKQAYVYGHRGWLGRQIAERRRLRRQPVTVPLQITVDETKLRDYVFSLVQVIDTPAENAQLIVKPDDTVEIAESSAGRRLDVPKFMADLRSALLSTTSRRVFLRVEIVEPEVTTEQVRAYGITGKMSSFRTRFNKDNLPRVANIVLASAMLDGSILAPGEVLSFNKVVGPRVPERGFQEADVIINQELVPDFGGGTCQVSTTLYVAAALAGMEVVSRSNHSLASTYVPLGYDAAVAYDYLDLKLRNNLPHHVLIKSAVQGDTVEFKLFGAPSPQRQIKLETKVLETIEPNVVEKEDSTLPKGERKVIHPGSPGHVVEVYRVVSEGGVELRRELLSRDRYKPRPRMVLVGTGPARPGAPSSAGAGDPIGAGDPFGAAGSLNKPQKGPSDGTSSGVSTPGGTSIAVPDPGLGRAPEGGTVGTPSGEDTQAGAAAGVPPFAAPGAASDGGRGSTPNAEPGAAKAPGGPSDAPAGEQ